MKELKRGQIAIDKKRFINFLNLIQAHINGMDLVMKEPSTELRGKKIAKHMNALQFELHAIQHFDLDIDLKRLTTKLLKSLPAKAE